jgi:hypothetical protein
MVRVAWMEKIMSKSNDTSRELTIDELEAVSGGMRGASIGVYPDPLPSVSDGTMISYGRAVAGTQTRS